MSCLQFIQKYLQLIYAYLCIVFICIFSSYSLLYSVLPLVFAGRYHMSSATTQIELVLDSMSGDKQ